MGLLGHRVSQLGEAAQDLADTCRSQARLLENSLAAAAGLAANAAPPSQVPSATPAELAKQRDEWTLRMDFYYEL